MRSVRFIVGLLLLLFLIGTVQAVVTLQITIKDSEGNTLSGAEIYIASSYIGVTDSYGRYYYSHAGTSSFNLRVSRNGYATRTVLVDSSQTTVTIPLTRTSTLLTVYVYDENIVPLRSAIVRVVGSSFEKTGETSSDGKAVFTLEDGETYQVFITALNYRDAQTSVELSGSSREISQMMTRSDQFAFRVTDAETGSPLSGAEITVDNVVRGVTGTDGTLSSHLKQGNEYLISVRASAYQSSSMRQYISSDQQVLSIRLSKAYHSPFVSVFDPEKKVIEGADVYLDGLLLRKTDTYGRASLNKLGAGTYLLEIRKPGFESYGQNITVSEDSIDFIANLVYTPVSVRVLVQDSSNSVISGAAITIAGEEKRTTDQTGLIFISLIPGQKYTLTVTKDGYRDGNAELTIPIDGLQDSVIITLESKPDLIIIGGAALVLLLLAGGIILLKKKRSKRGSSRRGKGW
ncbi:MAG: carboxypeptidase-like regulatory domain-containing protein [Methanocalculus sp.]|uniref:carboxypeptidase-like regulatory domain-containing protein n=1 Tax=Methanocalculus sp. TaxID=2004547 RepID=UPI002726A352|nr:carboxypeptidase-like regulatory domain-containing protein [Methanocalculus sp.]MDO8842325.1 carboxypeptidase-like regulatory domain-containing protein [Methanocalculus sp.]MDO9539274.1 carboxypeptidase-like regulatory domain-containing protein [Methanocalculus sp.]